jgi:hypothetical protein
MAWVEGSFSDAFRPYALAMCYVLRIFCTLSLDRTPQARLLFQRCRSDIVTLPRQSRTLLNKASPRLFSSYNRSRINLTGDYVWQAKQTGRQGPVRPRRPVKSGAPMS